MQLLVKVYADLFDVEARLALMGLKMGALLDAVRAAHLARLACTALDPPMYSAVSLWAVGVRRLRQQLLALKWTHSNEGGYCVVVSPDASHAITVASGDINTGKPGGTPTTTCPKGPRTAEAISANQLSLDLRLPEADEVAVADQQCETWLLLIHVDHDAAEVRAELSLPAGQDEQDRVTTWVERIILPSIAFQPDEMTAPIDDLPDVDIEIRRRG